MTLEQIQKELTEKYGYDLAPDAVSFIYNAGRIAGIEEAKDALPDFIESSNEQYANGWNKHNTDSILAIAALLSPKETEV